MPPSGKNIVKALQKAGFDIDRITGSHHIMRHPDGRVVPVPVHHNRDLPVGTYRSILRAVDIKDADLRDLM